MSQLDQLLADLTSKDDPRAEAAVVQIIHYGQPAFDALTKMAQDPDPDIRWWAIRALSEFTDQDASLLFIKALSDSDLEIQACAALALRLQPNPKAIPNLVNLLGHPDQLLSRLAGNALVALGIKSTQPLIDLVNEGNSVSQRTRLEAVRALAEIKDPTSISTLFKIYQEGSSIMQHWAEEGLNRMGIGMVFFDPG